MNVWTAEKLEAALRNALVSRASLRLAELPIDRSADVEWVGSGKARVRVDNFDVGLRPGVLHELLHVVLDEDLSGFDSGLGEVIICALEDAMNARIALSKRRLSWWRKEIHARLK